MNIYKELAFAQEYDLFYQTSRGQAVDKVEKALILDILTQVHGREMLELGCGTGHWTAFFNENGFRVIAVDESAAMLEQAQRKEISNVHWIKADASRLPFPDQRFDVIAAITLFEFVDDIDILFKEISRVLKPEGILITGWLNALSEVGKQKEHSSIFRHATLYTPEEIKKRLSLLDTAQLYYGVYYDEEFGMLDNKIDRGDVQPAFIASIVKKK
ncbi:MAG: class I SAM-dependent methyltransferase [Massilibacteroides sp.]|nr:class I SAM-dependent methyltransferase [Massilibacteroides sp.]MDD3061609.1 class I SAM-dependent methyltransferase [Massilibacteroides sp.]MDD4660007.1 class I SAM-dependent methyltransferase [Massilibacteroides sp.]